MSTKREDPFHLRRFVLAQNHQESFENALGGIRRGSKVGHWIWWIFPQLADLGTSPTARHYAITSLDEAVAYLSHPILGARLRATTSAMNSLLGARATSILGRDDVKFHSSITLFSRPAPADPLFTTALDLFFDGVADIRTNRLLLNHYCHDPICTPAQIAVGGTTR